jgi:hypothetical protein
MKEFAHETHEKNEMWTPEYVRKLLNSSSGDGGKIIADAHNAALAAESQRADDSIRENVRLMNELAAEREKRG